MEDILNHTQFYNYNWKNQLQKYDYNRTHLAWEKNPLPEKITTKMVKQNDLVYNPILQKYNNKEYDNMLRQKEKSAIFTSIINNQDNQLKIEQTFNIINLQDRLKGLENQPNYPIKKDFINKRKKINYDIKSYNILSNLPLNEHYYDKPENRPKCNISEVKKNSKFLRQERDFDIISTKYKHFNDEKDNIDKEISKIKTAKIFYKYNDYNPVKGVYFNEEKEKAYQEKNKEIQKNWGKEKFKNMPKCSKGKSDVYNLISLKVIDPQEYNRILKQEIDRKKRYQIRASIENYYREKNLIEQDREENKINGKDSYYRYKEQDNRQYDIIDLKERPFKDFAQKMKRQKYEGWDKILKGAGNNNTFKKKQIYKDPYDYSEAGLSYDNFKKIRTKTLASLPKIEEDKIFKQNKKISKCFSYHDILNNKKENTFTFNKEKFFREPPKNVNVSDSKYKCINGNKDKTGKEKAFQFNKEKNMRNLRKNMDFETTFENKK